MWQAVEHKEKKSKERNLLKLEKPFRKGSASFGRGYVKLKFGTRLTYKWLDNFNGLGSLFMYMTGISLRPGVV